MGFDDNDNESEDPDLEKDTALSLVVASRESCVSVEVFETRFRRLLLLRLFLENMRRGGDDDRTDLELDVVSSTIELSSSSSSSLLTTTTFSSSQGMLVVVVSTVEEGVVVVPIKKLGSIFLNYFFFCLCW